MFSKFKTLSAALLLCYLPQANAINIIFGERNPICLEAINRMNQDPHFFNRASKEQYHYILLESPFKRDYFEYVPMDMAYPLFLQQIARNIKVSIDTKGLNESVNEIGYYPLGDNEAVENKFRKIIYDFIPTAQSSASKYYNKGANAFAYKTNIQLSDKLYVIGFVSGLIYEERWSIPIQYFIVDEYMHFQPKVLEDYLDKEYYSMRYSPPNRLIYFRGDDAFVGVPIDIMGETFAIQVYVDIYTKKFNLGIFRNVYNSGYNLVEPVCEFSKDVY